MSRAYIVGVCIGALYAFIFGAWRLLTINEANLTNKQKWFFAPILTVTVVTIPIATIVEARAAW